MGRSGRPSLSGRHLVNWTEVTVRFQEVDSLRVVWHGHYISYFEDARVAFGRRYGMDYPDFVKQGLAVPLVHVSADYLAPARYGDVLDVAARLYWTEAAKLEFGYEVRRRSDASVLATGRSTQVFTDLEGNMQLVLPDFMREFYERWGKEAEVE
ncbi:MAG: acyl-CoA thioesterase [Planctomycetota bacterium]|jgi:acyl-CoA thioester hydrolase